MKKKFRLKIVNFLFFTTILVLFSISLISPITLSIPETSTSHDPISIGSNEELDEFCCLGDADGLSWDSAYIIENLEIDGGNTSWALELSSTDRYLIIQNCTFKNSKPDQSSTYCNEVHASGAVWVRSCSNVKIINCTIMSAGTAAAISLSGCENVTLTECNFRNGTRGIILIEINNCLISRNGIDLIIGEAILAIRSNYNTISNNFGTVNGFYGVMLDVNSGYNQVYDNCFEGSNLRNIIEDRGVNNDVYDNKCNLIPGYSIVLVIPLFFALTGLFYSVQKKRK